MKNQKDKLDVLIGNRIAERQRKLKRLQEMEGGGGKTIWMKFTPLAIAACLTIAVIIGTRQSQDNGLQEACRAASPEIQQLIEKGEWDKAYTMVIEEINDADSAINQLVREDTTDEESAYELQVERQKREDMSQLEKEIMKKMKQCGSLIPASCINKRKQKTETTNYIKTIKN